MSQQRRQPTVFISSTSEDLAEYRAEVETSAQKARFNVRMMEYFAATGGPPLEDCMREIAGDEDVPQCDVLVVIVAYRYGWVPKDQPENERKSITWLECEEAERLGKKVLAFLVSEKQPWDEKHKEDFRLNIAMRSGKATPELFGEVQDNLAKLEEFRAWLKTRTVGSFTTPDNLSREVLHALTEWRRKQPEFRYSAEELSQLQQDPTIYLQALRDETSHLDIQGLGVSSGIAHRLAIDEIYIPLSTPGSGRVETGDAWAGRLDAAGHLEESGMLLERTVRKNGRLAVVGDPGSGKSTFLRRLACTLARFALGEATAKDKDFNPFDEQPPFPMLIRLAELDRFLQKTTERKEGPLDPDDPEWFARYLEHWSSKKAQSVASGFFEKHLQEGTGVLLLDGLDEAASRKRRKGLLKLIETAAGKYGKTHIIVTSRPAAYQEQAVANFESITIAPLKEEDIDTFLTRWYEAIYAGDPSKAAHQSEELKSQRQARPELSRITRNPVMLTALAVVHWNEKRLPEQRADLYEAIIKWLSIQREEKPGRLSPELCVGRLQHLALEMQNHKKGRQEQVTLWWAAGAIASTFREEPEGERRTVASRFLEEEEVDSGIVVGRGNEIRFWHLTFQEYLAARALAGKDATLEQVLTSGKILEPEWREVLLLLGGVLHGQDVERVDGLFDTILTKWASKCSFDQQMAVLGLLGDVVRDLSPYGYRPHHPIYDELLKTAPGLFHPASEVAIQTAITAAEALSLAGDPRFEGEDHWVDLPESELRMGAQSTTETEPNYDSEAYEDESPTHHVRLSSFEIGRYPVTVGEFAGFLAAEGYQNETHWREGGFGLWNEPLRWSEQRSHRNRPVIHVSWFEAAAFASWAGAQLPTEAQWERAARGTEGCRFPWGNTATNSELLNYETNVGEPTPVGIYPKGATPEGICDLSGNVWEWCADWFGDYEEGDRVDPPGPPDGNNRVLRGGAWLNYAGTCRGSSRTDYTPDVRDLNVGFRLVRVSQAARTKKRKS